jgi:hypothetical protein
MVHEGRLFLQVLKGGTDVCETVRLTKTLLNSLPSDIFKERFEVILRLIRRIVENERMLPSTALSR